MKKGFVFATIAIIVIGGIWWFIASQPKSDTTTTGSSQNAADDTAHTATDQTQTTAVAVDMKNITFSPERIKIKKGTTVTWTNQDVIRHNVVASDAGNSGGLPTENDLLDKGGTYSFTFNTVGTFAYHCTPHASSMKGIVEVVE